MSPGSTKLGYVGMTAHVCRAVCKPDSRFMVGDDGSVHQSFAIG
jgi:hypothetical protein